MKYLDYITGILNSALRSVFPGESVRCLGVAQLARRSQAEGDKYEVWPVVYSGDGELESASFDDSHDLSSYHRSVGLSAQRIPGGYGDGLGYIKLMHRMSLVVWAQRDKIGMSSDHLALLLQFGLPDRLAKEQLPQHFQSVTISVNDVVLNEEQVFNEEFKNVDYFIMPEHVLLKCNYTIESIVSKRCFNTTCSQPAA